MDDKRYKELMATVGMPNSQSLLFALQQAVNETEQAQQAEIDELRKKLNRFLKRSHQKNVDITELVDMLNVIWEDWSCDECPEYEQMKALIAKHKEKE